MNYDRRTSIAIGVTVAAVVWTVVAVIWAIYANFDYSRDIDAWINRAQVAAEPHDMSDYLRRAMDGMDDRGATSGHTAVLLKKPDNDLGLLYRAMDQSADRLDEIGELPKNETTYQVALDDLRGTIREMANPAAGIMWVRLGVFLLWGTLLLWAAVSGVWIWEGA